MTATQAELDGFSVRASALLENATDDTRLTYLSRAIAAKLKAYQQDPNTNDFDPNLVAAGLSVLQVVDGIKAMHMSTGNQAAECDLNDPSSLRDLLFNEDGKITPTCIPSIMLPDEHGHPMLPYNTLLEVCPCLPDSIVRNEHQRTTLSCEHCVSDGVSNLRVFLDFFYAVAGYFGHDIHRPFDPEFRALYDD
ncbi:uncharacterized protein N7473_009722 [Penicillium subrubescens]|uniref:Uncharacterized protein n=1 Tax=Penicillium subrubescens TaxID=1316194 RepID=A0A1Q5THI2_9EURO|nr:uncharacterized protein N7473_009722 [Penicillium subrubescens]KAJ5887048.1 hypothetical protein N7473_009722 [Penicillium subrubescens]OKO99684.1 hypothetical protein PENSUB_8337 [Penicillium subrubescens]